MLTHPPPALARTHTHTSALAHIMNTHSYTYSHIYSNLLYTDNGLLLLTVNLADSVMVLLVTESIMLHV